MLALSANFMMTEGNLCKHPVLVYYKKPKCLVSISHIFSHCLS